MFKFIQKTCFIWIVVFLNWKLLTYWKCKMCTAADLKVISRYELMMMSFGSALDKDSDIYEIRSTSSIFWVKNAPVLLNIDNDHNISSYKLFPTYPLKWKLIFSTSHISKVHIIPHSSNWQPTDYFSHIHQRIKSEKQIFHCHQSHILIVLYSNLFSIYVLIVLLLLILGCNS